MDDESMFGTVFDQVHGSLNVSDNHVLFNHFLSCKPFVNCYVYGPLLFVKLELYLPIFKDLEHYSVVSMLHSDFCKILEFFHKTSVLLLFALMKLVEFLIRALSCNDVLNFLIG